MASEPAGYLVRRIERMAGARAVGWREAAGGLTLAQRWVVEFEGGARAFAKVAMNGRTAGWLRAEQRVYSAVKAEWLAKVIAWSDDGRQPILLLEDLSVGVWPPPWTGEGVGRVLGAMAEVRRAEVSIPLLRLKAQREGLMQWRKIAKDPRGFLALGLATAGWLAKALPRLIEAEGRARLDGDELVHGDMKGGNVCLRGGRCVVIDWNWACRGNGMVDVADWLAGAYSEGGPAPDEVCGGLGELGALLVGYTASCAARPGVAEAPGLRGKQLEKARACLPWVCRELGLAGPDLG